MEAQENITAEKLAEVYIKIRDSIAVIEERHAEELKDLKDQQQLITDRLLEICKEQDASSISTKAGTIMRRVDTRYWTNDWDSLYTFIKEHDAFPLLHQRINTLNMRQFLEENPDLTPMGLMADSKYAITIRRSKK